MVMDRVDRNTNAITAMNMRMTNIEGKISNSEHIQQTRVMELEERITHDRFMLGSRTSRETAYDKARRSLRVWPIKGENDSELKMNFREFATDALLISADAVESTRIAEIIRVRTSPAGRAYLEICVTFETVKERDFFNSKARNLTCLLYTSPSPRDRQKSRMPSSA